MKSLIVLTGLTPAVVTETVWALARLEGWVPDRVVVLSSKAGLRLVEAELKPDAATGRAPWARMLASIKRTESPPTLVREECRLVDAAHQPVLDVVDEDSINAMTGCIVKAYDDAINFADSIKEKSSNDVVLALAGGRNAMSFVASQALCLLGRAEDRVCQVIVDYPEKLLLDQAYSEFEAAGVSTGALRSSIEQCSDFYFPETGRSQATSVRFRRDDGSVGTTRSKLEFAFDKAVLHLIWLPVLTPPGMTDEGRERLRRRVVADNEGFGSMVRNQRFAEQVNALVMCDMHIKDKKDGPRDATVVLFGRIAGDEFLPMGVVSGLPATSCPDAFTSPSGRAVVVANGIATRQFNSLVFAMWWSLDPDQRAAYGSCPVHESNELPYREPFRDMTRPDKSFLHKQLKQHGLDLFLADKITHAAGKPIYLQVKAAREMRGRINFGLTTFSSRDFGLPPRVTAPLNLDKTLRLRSKASTARTAAND